MELDVPDSVPNVPYSTEAPRGRLARLELRIDPEQTRLIEAAAAVERRCVSAFVVDALVRRARAVVSGREGHAPRPIGGWSFVLPDGWDAPLDDFADWR